VRKHARVPGTYGGWQPYGKPRRQRRRRRWGGPPGADLGSRILHAAPPKLKTYDVGDLVKLLGNRKGGDRG